jgi:hypothetical protein
MSIIGSKNIKAMSIMSTKSDGGKARDKHCFGTTIKAKKCGGNKISGKNFGRHRTEDHGGKEPERVEICTQDECEHC